MNPLRRFPYTTLVANRNRYSGVSFVIPEEAFKEIRSPRFQIRRPRAESPGGRPPGRIPKSELGHWASGWAWPIAKIRNSGFGIPSDLGLWISPCRATLLALRVLGADLPATYFAAKVFGASFGGERRGSAEPSAACGHKTSEPQSLGFSVRHSRCSGPKFEGSRREHG